MALTKEKKKEVVAEYGSWLEKSRALIVTEYTGVNMKAIDDLRSKVREAGGEFHVVKNTLVKLALADLGYEYGETQFTGSTAIGFAFEDAPALAKAISDFAKTSDFVNIKFGYLDRRAMTAAEVNALADMPPLPVMRAQLLGTIMAPASQLARVLAEPGRQIAAVIKAYADKDAVPEAA